MTEVLMLTLALSLLGTAWIALIDSRMKGLRKGRFDVLRAGVPPHPQMDTMRADDVESSALEAG